MRSLISQLRRTIRLLLKSPGFTITAVLILGFGIGANTAIFSLINTVLLKPLPYPHPDRLVQICQGIESSPDTQFDYPDYQDVCHQQTGFSDLAAIRTWHFDLSGQGEPLRLTGGYVSASFFKVFSVPFLLGRPITETEDIPGGPLVAIINERIWKNHFGGDPAIIGKKINLDNQSCLIVGVAPAQIEDWTAGLDVLLPLNVMPVFGNDRLFVRATHRLDCYGRLKEGVTLSQAQAECGLIQMSLSERYPESDRGYTIHVIPLLRGAVSDYAPALWVLGAAVACLLLIACANVANLFLTRALDRKREMNVRAAMGASRLRLACQLAFETAFLSILGGLLGLVIAICTIGFIKALSPQQDLARFERVGLDETALLFCFGATMVTSLLFGIFPAWNLSKVNPGSALRGEDLRSATTGHQRQRLQSLLIIAQVALACILLVAAGLLMRSFQATQAVRLGFNPHGLLAAQIELSGIHYGSDSHSLTFFLSLLEKVRRLPGVSAVALNPDPPFNDWNGIEPFGVAGRPDAEPGQETTLEWQCVTPGYFRTLEIPLLAGRDFDDDDVQKSQKVVIIDQAMADRLFPGQDPIGKQIHDYEEKDKQERGYFTIIGVTKNIRHDSPDSPSADFQAYFPFPLRLRDGILLVRTEKDPLALVPAVRKAVAAIDPTVALAKVSTFDGWIGKKFMARRLSTLLVSLFSGAALCLSAIGVYGVLAYSVGQRTRELGIRIALGAQSDNILRLITAQGLRIVGVGLIVGLLASLILVRFIEGILYGVSATDPFSLCAAVIVLGLAALVACLLPAHRATRINPITALRE